MKKLISFFIVALVVAISAATNATASVANTPTIALQRGSPPQANASDSKTVKIATTTTVAVISARTENSKRGSPPQENALLTISAAPIVTSATTAGTNYNEEVVRASSNRPDS